MASGGGASYFNMSVKAGKLSPASPLINKWSLTEISPASVAQHWHAQRAREGATPTRRHKHTNTHTHTQRHTQTQAEMLVQKAVEDSNREKRGQEKETEQMKGEVWSNDTRAETNHCSDY